MRGRLRIKSMVT